MIVPIYKVKGYALECGKYRGIRLLEHGLKLFEKVSGERLRKSIKMSYDFSKKKVHFNNT